MYLVDESNAEGYLRGAGILGPDESVRVEPLAGGVSNQVLRIHFPESQRGDLVVKQARERLRVAEPWFCGVERIWREVETLRICQACLAAESSAGDGLELVAPRVVFEDRDNYLYAMSAAPPDHGVWKHQLLRGETDVRIARACGRMLGLLHGTTWRDEAVATRLGDRSFFEQLRVDPYYRHVARHSPPFRCWLESLIASLDDHRLSLVHGDFSPKNLLVYDRHVMLVDYEVGHFGDPAFDLGFFLTHLVLKAIRAGASRAAEYLRLGDEFWDRYVTTLGGCVEGEIAHPGNRAREDACAMGDRAMRHLAGCLIARIDGKSQVEYLPEPSQRELVRGLAARLFVNPCWEEVAARLLEI